MLVSRSVAATFVLLLAGLSAHAEETRRLSGDEIRSQILGHEFLSHFRSDEGTGLTEMKAYFSTAGKLVVQLTKDDKPIDLGIETFEVKEDLLCLHDHRLMKSDRADRCFAAYVEVAEKSWSGRLVDQEDKDAIVPLDTSLDADSAEVDAQWANWESIRQEVGSVDSFGVLDEIALNPFRFAGKVQIMRGTFRQMIGDHRGAFDTQSRADQNRIFIVDGVSNEAFQKEGQSAVIVGDFTGSLQVTIDGNDRFLPVMTAKAVRLCEKDSCEDFFPSWW